MGKVTDYASDNTTLYIPFDNPNPDPTFESHVTGTDTLAASPGFPAKYQQADPYGTLEAAEPATINSLPAHITAQTADGAGPFTFQTWYKNTEGSPVGNESDDKILTNNRVGRDMMFGTTVIGGPIEVINIKMPSGAAGSTSHQGTTDIGDGNWHHIALTINAGVARVFIDGVFEVDSTSAPVGTGTWGGFNLFQGRVGSVGGSILVAEMFTHDIVVPDSRIADYGDINYQPNLVFTAQEILNSQCALRELVNMGGHWVEGFTHEGSSVNLIDNDNSREGGVGVANYEVYGCFKRTKTDGLTSNHQYDGDDLDNILTDGFKAIIGITKDTDFTCDIFDSRNGNIHISYSVDASNAVSYQWDDGVLAEGGVSGSSPTPGNIEYFTTRILVIDQPASGPGIAKLYYAYDVDSDILLYHFVNTPSIDTLSLDPGFVTFEIGSVGSGAFYEVDFSLLAWNCTDAETYDAERLARIAHGLITSGIKGANNNFEKHIQDNYNLIISTNQFLNDDSLSMSPNKVDMHKLGGRDTSEAIPDEYKGIKGARNLISDSGDTHGRSRVYIPAIAPTGCIVFAGVIKGQVASGNRYIFRVDLEDTGEELRVLFNNASIDLQLDFSGPGNDLDCRHAGQPVAEDVYATWIMMFQADRQSATLWIDGSPVSLTVNPGDNTYAGDEYGDFYLGANSNGNQRWHKQIAATALFTSDSLLTNDDALALHESMVTLIPLKSAVIGGLSIGIDLE